jgi:membrane protease YdiL (CAAX protease family)
VIPVPDSQPAVSLAMPRWRWWIHLLLIAAFPLLIGIQGIGGSEMRGPALSRGTKGLLFVCALQLLIFAVVFGAAWLASRASRDDLLCRWRGGYWTVLLGIGYSVAIRLALGIMVLVVAVALTLTQVTSAEDLKHFFTANRPDVEVIVDVSAMRQNPVYFWLTVTLVSFVLGGLREEIWRSAFLAGMRALWPQSFGSRIGQIIAVSMAAVIFGIAHLAQGVVAAGMAAFLGFVLGLIMVLHRSIWPAVIAHGVFDATSLALVPWVMEKMQEIR